NDGVLQEITLILRALLQKDLPALAKGVVSRLRATFKMMFFGTIAGIFNNLRVLVPGFSHSEGHLIETADLDPKQFCQRMVRHPGVVFSGDDGEPVGQDRIFVLLDKKEQ
ncbi:hypothetical protein, partial [Thiolapillus sp.]